MATVKKMFSEFRSIFVTENVLKENERHANVVTATSMLNLFLIILISWILIEVKIFKPTDALNNYVVLNSFLGLFVPAIICFILKGEKKWLKYMLLGMFILILGTIDSHMSYMSAFLMVIPIILSARYYKKFFTILTSIVTFIVFLIVAFSKGINYFNYSQELISALLFYYVIVFASTQISQSGKKMIEKQKEIAEKGARIETELNLANAIQNHMLPSTFPPFPEHKDIDIYASMTPAKEVGGDFYDMFLLDDTHLIIAIADVSGKGIPAALFMMISKILIKNVAKTEMHVNEIFNRVNTMLCEGNEEDIFVTSWLGLLDLTTGKLNFVNAGHNPPLIYSKKRGTFDFLRTNPNMVMACMENIEYDEHEIYLEPGDKIFLYTDGVVEATNTRNVLYGESRLKDFLNSHLDLDPTKNIIELKRDLRKFSGEASQFDDITMLQLDYKSESNNKQYMEKSFDATITELPDVENYILEELKKRGFSKKSSDQIILATEEIFINIVKYAYKDTIGYCRIKMSFDEDDTLTCTFEDSGTPFNPLEKKDPDLTGSAKERNVGGLGIYMSKNVMDKIKYEYKNRKNKLTIIKKK